MFIPDPNLFHSGSRIRLKEFKYFNPKKWYLSTHNYDPGFSSRIQIPDPGVKKAPDLGSGSITLKKNLGHCPFKYGSGSTTLVS